MKKKEAFLQYIETFFDIESQSISFILNETVKKQQNEIIECFYIALKTVKENVQLLQDKNAEIQWVYGECSFLISQLLQQFPCFIFEAFSENWYLELLDQKIFHIPYLSDIWNKFRNLSRMKAKEYIGLINLFEVDVLLIDWWLKNINILIPYYQIAIKLLFPTDSNNYSLFTFGEYRGLNEKILY